MAAEESVSRKKHRRSPADEADESSKRRKHHHHRRHHSHRHRSKHDLDKRENDERRVAALNSRMDDDREEGEILDEEEENKEGPKGRMESDVESGEIKPDAEASCSKDDRLAIHGEGGEEEGNLGQRVSRPTMSGELTSNSGGNINIEFPDRTLPTADKEHVEGKFDDSILEHRSSGLKEKDLHGLGVVNGDVEDISSKRDVRYTESKSPTKITLDENDSMGIDSRHSRRYSRSRSPVLRESVEPSKKRRRDEDTNSDKYGVRRLAESSNTRSVSPNKSRDKYRTLEDSPSMNVGYHDGRNRSRSRDCVRERIFQSADDKSIIYYHERRADRSKSSDSRESSKIDYDSGIFNKYNRRGQNGSRESARELEMKRVEGKERERSSSYGLYGRNSGKEDSHSSRKVNGGGDRDRGRDRDWETHKERERSSSDIRHDGRERDRERERGKDRERSSTYVRHDGREMDRERERGRDREQTSSYSRHDERLRDREKERGKDRDWERAQVRFKEREKESGRGRGRDRDREMERDKNRRDSRSHRYDYLDEGHNSQDHRDKTRSRKESNDLEESKEKAREEDEQEDYEERVALKLAEQEEEDVERIKEESRKRRQAILEKYKQQQKQSQQKHTQFQSYPFSDHTEKGENASMLDDRPREQNSPPQASVSVVSQAVHHGLDDRHDSSDVYVADSSFSVGKSPVQNGTSDFEKTAGAGGLGDGTPKSERASDMFCDDIFGESPAGARKSGKGDALQIERNGLHDNWDDAEGYYSYRFGEVLDGRYEITAAHGKGVFSTVVRAKDLKAGKCDPQEVAIKIIRNNDTMYKAGLEELIILKKLAGADPEDKRHCVRFLSSFKYRSHLCLVFESLHMNLREVLKKFGRNIGLKLTAVRAYAKQLFIALKHLRNCGVLHCDIKPDNMLVNEAKNVLKLCDFGNAMFAGKNEITPYLVSRFYRSPEIILGLPYDHPMDIWSVGCCLYELYSGKVLFPGPSNNDMLRLHMELKGPFPKKMLRKGAFTDQHFDQDLNFHATEEDPVTKKAVKRLLLNIKLKDICSLITSSPGEDPKMLANFKDLLERVFVLDPDKRMTVSQALAHPFITGK